eukprot:PhM_4_TR7849/c0_g1_i1/m.11168
MSRSAISRISPPPQQNTNNNITRTNYNNSDELSFSASSVGDVHVFKVRLHGFHVKDLDITPFLDDHGPPASFTLFGSFDGRKFASPSPLVPRDYNLLEFRDLESRFEYHVQKSMSLSSRSLEVELRMETTKKTATNALPYVVLSSVRVDLATLATGPVLQDLPLVSHAAHQLPNHVFGSMEFRAHMELQSTAVVTLQDVTISPLPVQYNAFLSYNFVTDDQPDNVGDVSWATRMPQWGRSLPSLYILTTLRELYENSIVVRVKHKSNPSAREDDERACPTIGTFELPIQKYLHAHTPHSTKFQATLRHVDGPNSPNFVVPVEGYIEFRELPGLAQMTVGKNTERGVLCGVPLVPTLPTPLRHVTQSEAEYVPKVLKVPPPERQSLTRMVSSGHNSVVSPPRVRPTSQAITSYSNNIAALPEPVRGRVTLTPLRSPPKGRTQPFLEQPTRITPSAQHLNVTPNASAAASFTSPFQQPNGHDPTIRRVPARRPILTPAPYATPLPTRDNPMAASAFRGDPNRRSVLSQSRRRVEDMLDVLRQRRAAMEAEATERQAARDNRRKLLRRQLAELQRDNVAVLCAAMSPNQSPTKSRPTNSSFDASTSVPTLAPVPTRRDRDDEELMALCTSGSVLDVEAWLRSHPSHRFASGKSEAFGPLHCVCRTPRDCSVDMLSALLQHGVQDVNAQDSHLNTPLHYACASRDPSLETVHLLVEHGARCDIFNDAGEAALHVACRNVEDRTHKLKRYLIFRAGVPVNQTTLRGDTALHLVAADDSYFDSVVFLVEAGAGVGLESRSGSGQTPVQIARSVGPPASLNLAYLLKQ